MKKPETDAPRNGPPDFPGEPQTVVEHTSTDPHDKVTAELRHAGLRGQLVWAVVHPVKAENANQPIGQPGAYKVLATLARPDRAPLADDEFSFEDHIRGDSHVQVGPPTLPIPPGGESIRLRMFIGQQEFTLEGTRNDEGFLATLHTQVNASNPFDAEVGVYRAIAPYLSTVSTNLDVPLVVWRLLVIEVASGARFMRRRAPSLYAPFHAVPQVQMSPDFRSLASLYREAIVSNSPAYEYLCLFKVAEAIVKRREVKDKTLVAEGKKPERPRERIPNEPSEMLAWLRSVYILGRHWELQALEGVFPPKSRGRKVRDLLDGELRDLRHRVAHGLLDDDVEIAALADRSLFVDEVQEWLPLLRSIVRVMLKNDYPEEFLPTLRKDGTIDVEKAVQLSKVTDALRSRGVELGDGTQVHKGKQDGAT